MGDSEPSDRDPLGEIERVFGLMNEQFGTHRTAVPVDVIDTDDAFVVHADLPGASAGDIDVTIEDGRVLTIAAERETEETEGRHVQRERSKQAVRRTVRLPDAVDAEGTTASYDAGVLTVELHREREDDGTSIPVN
jgi:HSP20 family protein